MRDPDGKVLSDTGQKPSRSFVIAFLEFIYAMLDGVGLYYAEDTSGASNLVVHTGLPSSAQFSIGAGINDDTYGLVVGTGVTPEDNEDDALDTQLTEGVGAGNITHGAMLIGTAAVVGANVDLALKRAFTNNTGSTITVKEAGLYTTIPPYFHCIIRDVLAASVDVPDKCSLTVIYTVRTTV